MDSEEQQQYCGNCRFWKDVNELDQDEHYGLCKRYPPPLTRDVGFLAFPEMEVWNWCGEWQPQTKG